MMDDLSYRERALLSEAFAKIDMPAMAVALGILGSVVLVLATVILLLQDLPVGVPVGPHLNTLADYFPGYSVSWIGCVIGAFYGFLIGAILGFFVAVIWNLTHYFVLGILVAKAIFSVD